MDQHPIVVILSGGLDSAVLLDHAVDTGRPVHAVSFDYGQRHRMELDHAWRIAARKKVPHRIFDLAVLRFAAENSGSCLTDRSIPVPVGHYEDESMRTTVVPHRNLMMLTVAAAYAESSKLEHARIWYGAHAGDHAIYPDCRAPFVACAQEAIRQGSYIDVTIAAPFIHYRKEQIVARGAELGTPFEMTYSCYSGEEIHCGRCGTCTERREAFRLAGVNDPTTYAAMAEGPAF